MLNGTILTFSEAAGKIKSLKIMKLNRPEDPGTSILVHGKAEEVDLLMEPNCVSMSASVGYQDRSTITITNPSLRLSVYFEFLKIPYVTTKPVEGVIKPSQTIEVLIVFSAKSLGMSYEFIITSYNLFLLSCCKLLQLFFVYFITS